jgi:hypothetical protein
MQCVVVTSVEKDYKCRGSLCSHNPATSSHNTKEQRTAALHFTSFCLLCLFNLLPLKTSLLRKPSTKMSQSRGYRSTGVGGAGNFRPAPTASVNFFAAVSLRKREFTKYGIGGAGNYRRVDELALSAAPSISSDVSEARSTRSSYTIGIGGAGNVVNIADDKSSAEMPSFSCKSFSPG